MKNRILLCVLSVVFVISGCKSRMRQEIKTQYDRPLPLGSYALRKITNPYEIPDFTIACLNTIFSHAGKLLIVKRLKV